MKATKTYLQELTALNAVSSKEDPVIQYMKMHFSEYSNEVTVDRIGNVICHFPSNKEDSKKVMIFGHMDEVGFMIRYIDEKGFIYIERIGGSNINVLPGSRVDIIGEKGTVIGLFGTKAYHFLKPEEKGTLPNQQSLYIDIGVKSKEEAEAMGVKVGCWACYHSDFIERENGWVTNKAMDNRVACTILLQLAEQLSTVSTPFNWDIYLVACVQEEFNIRGVLPAVRKINPDVSIGIDVTPACDTPDLNHYSDVVLDGGPALTFLNYHGKGTLAGVLPDEQLLQAFIQISEVNNVPYQREVAVGVITENAFIVFEEYGVAVANVSIPTRYTHTPIETISLHDLEQTVRLLFNFLTHLDESSHFGKNH
ncbi:putative aminopeptidase SgcX [Pullulanibacillus camelliae]|uniref:Putative aminopeptidase SgcX n=1 Tax=Pullulanibacillus camelliae TaxID=1707096 RepID=A0A8J2VLK8_9BACL|nr:M42 family metallopeptidase [Pullulanibacillus camelliae]GGE31567.1 putative aminopeptidase SgcX [Pullulanibacillus camelliae]